MTRVSNYNRQELGEKNGRRLRGSYLVLRILSLAILVLVMVLSLFYFEVLSELGFSSYVRGLRFVQTPCNSTLDPGMLYSWPPINNTASLNLRTNTTCSQPCKLCEERGCPPAAVREKIIVQEKIVEKVVNVDSGPVFKQWWAEERPWHTPGMFPLCSMDTCFNFTRCENMDELLVYPYNSPIPPNLYFEGFNSTPWYTADADNACLFFVFQDLDSPWRPHPNELPHWNKGLNHVLITLPDLWYQRNPPADTIENASVLSSGLYETTYRPGFDIGIPLPGQKHVQHIQSLKPSERKYFLTFRGTRYLGRTAEGTFRSDPSLRNMHNGEDVVVVTSCKHPINDMVRKEKPEFGEWCDEDQKLYDQYEFGDLMNSTFCLAPAGKSASSYRFIEILSAGAIPVLVADNHVKPFENIIQWPRCALQFPTSEMHRVVPALRGMAQTEIEKRQKYCLWVYDEFLKDDATLLHSVMRALKARFSGVFAKFSEQSPIKGGKKRRIPQFLPNPPSPLQRSYV